MTQLIEVAASLALNPDMAKVGAILIDKLLGEPCQVAGHLIADQIYFWQWKNRIRIAEKAEKILQEKAVAAKVLPAGFLVPLLDAAGDVEDETLQDMWANLLVAGVESETNQHPAFIGILKDINGDEARLISFLAANNGLQLPQSGIGVSTLESYPAISQFIEWKYVRNFDATVEEVGMLPLYFDHLESLRLIENSTNSIIWLTRWGNAFVESCCASSPPSQ